jgi:hypothetical protein
MVPDLRLPSHAQARTEQWAGPAAPLCRYYRRGVRDRGGVFVGLCCSRPQYCGLLSLGP